MGLYETLIADTTFKGIRLQGTYVAVEGFAVLADYDELIAEGLTYDTIYLQITGSKLRGVAEETPTEIMEHIFTDGSYSLSAGDPLWRASLMSEETSDLHASEDMIGSINKQASLTDTAIAYMIDTTILNLPTEDGRGFLDSSRRFGLGWDFDVLTATKQSRTGYMFSTDNDMWKEISQDEAYDNLYANPTYYPWNYATWLAETSDPTSIAWFQNSLLGITYGQTTTAFDYYDTMGGYMDMATINSNDILHSNEVYRIYPSDLGGTSIAGTHPSVNLTGDKSTLFSVADHSELNQGPGVFKLSLNYGSDVKKVFASKFHGTDSSFDIEETGSLSLTTIHPYGGTLPEEQNQFGIKISAACEEVLEEYNITEWPKRLINHVQRRQLIPDTALSAFGALATSPEDYDTTTAGSGVGTSEDYYDETMERGYSG